MVKIYAGIPQYTKKEDMEHKAKAGVGCSLV